MSTAVCCSPKLILALDEKMFMVGFMPASSLESDIEKRRREKHKFNGSETYWWISDYF